MQATYYFACNLLLGLPPPAFLKNNATKKKKCKEMQLAGGFASGVQLPSRVSALGGRVGVELGRQSLLLPPPPPGRLGEEGGGRPDAGEGGFCWQLLSGGDRAAAAGADPAAQTMRGWGTCRHATAPGPRVRTRQPPPGSCSPPPSPEGVSGWPAPSAAETPRHRFRATPWPRAQ